MDSETIAILTLAAYAAIAVLGIVWHCRGSGLSWQNWFLSLIERTYVPLMFRVRANRRCPFPDGAAIIVANHRSPVDPMFLWHHVHLSETGVRPIRLLHFMMASEYLDVPGIGWLTRNQGVIPVERSGRDLAPARAALKMLQDGEWIGIFPEGRINRGIDLMEADSGVAWMALRSRAPVYPVFIHNSPQGRTMTEPFLSPGRVRVTYGDPIDLSEYYDRRKNQETLREVTELMMRRLAELGGVKYGGPNVIPFDAPQSASA